MFPADSQRDLFENLFGQSDSLELSFRKLQRMIPSTETNYATHGLHNYPAKFLPHFSRIFIEHFTKEKEVLEKFWGQTFKIRLTIVSNEIEYGHGKTTKDRVRKRFLPHHVKGKPKR